jgi:hypothetical protein
MQTESNHKKKFLSSCNFSFQLKYNIHSFHEGEFNTSDSEEGNQETEFAPKNLLRFLFKYLFIFQTVFTSELLLIII